MLIGISKERAAASIILFLIIFVFTMIQLQIQKTLEVLLGGSDDEKRFHFSPKSFGLSFV